MPRDRGEVQTPPAVIFYLLVILILALDQWTKFLALSFLSSRGTLPVLPGMFHLTLVHNTGIAFGFFRHSQILLFTAITLSLIILLVWGGRNKNIALALILGGAVGNWIDRLRFGAVVDFLDFRIWPVFNVADSAITIGVGLYLWALLRKK